MAVSYGRTFLFTTYGRPNCIAVSILLCPSSIKRMCEKKLPSIYHSTYRCKKKNGYNTHIYWVCSRFVTLQLSKMGLYNEKTLIGRLHKYFSAYFETFSAPSAEMLFLLILSILALESAHSIRFLYRHFLSGITKKSLNTYYHACSYAKVDCSGFMNVTAKIALHLIPESL